MTKNRGGTWLRAAAVSTALLALAAPAALADPPGYDFLDWTRIFPAPAAKGPMAQPYAGASRAVAGERSSPLSAKPDCG